MPHAESPTTETMTNGDQRQSQFINHMKSYPVVNDMTEKFSTNPYGAKSIEVADATYSRFGKPLEQYLQGPMAYAKPYVEKVDSMADRSLNTVDAHFPIVKEETNTVVDKAVGLAMLPFNTAGRGYNYVMSTWNDEYNKTVQRGRGPGVTTSVMAIVSTELKIVSDCLQVAADVLARKDNNGQMGEARQKLENGSEHAKNMAGTAKANVEKASQQAKGAANSAKKNVDNQVNNAKKQAGQ